MSYEPGIDRHEWESEFESLEEDIRTDPYEALSSLDDLVHRMLEETGYDVDDPVAREGDEREVVAEFLAAREIKQAVERESEGISGGDVAAAINGYTAVYEYLLENRSDDADIA
jgi:hypothetical protein